MARPLEDLTRFLIVADARNVTRAAEILGVSQPALSRTVALLEHRFGVVLFERTANGVRLTPEGTTLYHHASRAVRAINEAEEEMSHSVGGRQRTVSLAAGDGWGYGVLPKIIADFSARFADTAVRLDIVEFRDRMAGLRNGTYEIVFGAVDPKVRHDRTYRFVPLVSAPFAVYCDERHPLREEPIPAALRLLDYPWVHHRFEYDLDPSRMLRTRRRYAFRTNTMLNTIEMIRNSTHLVAASTLFANVLQRHGLRQLCLDPDSPQFVSGPTHLTTIRLRHPAQTFLRHTIEACRENDLSTVGEVGL